MKNMIKKLSLLIVALFAFMMVTDAKIKETDNYTEDTYIIGYSRFSGKTALTADMAAKAGQYYERIYPQLYGEDPEDVKVYLKSELDGVWYNAKTGKPLSDKETKELTEKLFVFFVDGVEKSFEVSYSGKIDDGTLTKGVTYKDGKFIIPASKISFEFESNGYYVYVETKCEYNEETDEYINYFGEFEFYDSIPIDLSSIVLTQSESIVDEYYNVLSNTKYTEVIDDYYVNVGKLEGEEIPESLGINYNWYDIDESKTLSVGLNSFIDVPVWKIDSENNILIALPWLAADSLPEGTAKINIENQEIHLSLYPSDEEKELTIVSASPLYTVDGFTNQIEYDSENEQFYYLSGHGRHGYGLSIIDENGPITDENQIIFRKDLNTGSMGITFPEEGYTYVSIPKWQDEEYTIEYSDEYNYTLAIPGKGVIDLSVCFETSASPIDLSREVEELTNTFKDTFYNKFNSTILAIDDEQFSKYYIEIGEYTGEEENPEWLNTSNDSYSNIDLKTISIGNNAYIEAPVWQLKDNKIYIAIPWLVIDSIFDGETNIDVGGQVLKVKTYPNRNTDYVYVSDAKGLYTVDGYMNDVTWDGNTITNISSHGAHAIGIDICDFDDNVITGEDQLIFRMDENSNMVMTTADNTHTYVFYPNYNDGEPYASTSSESHDYILALPGYGVTNISINFVSYTPSNNE